MKICFLFFFLLLSSLYADPIELSFQDLSAFAHSKEGFSKLKEMNGKEVQIRGFLYPLNENRETWILAAQPDLQSCCVGNANKIKNQILVKGNMIVQTHAVNMNGIFQVDPKYDEQGNLIQMYLLEQAKIVPNKTPLAIWEILGGAFLILSIVYVKLHFFKKFA